MEVPFEERISVSRFQTTMDPVMGFKSRKIAFQGIAGSRDIMVVDNLKHIRLGFDQHPAGSLQIAEDPAFPGCGCDPATVLFFPSGDISQEAITLVVVMNTGNP